MPNGTREGTGRFTDVIKAKTTTPITVSAAEHDVIFTTEGATAAITFNLPAITAVPVGTKYTFFNVSAYGMVVTATTACCVAKNNAAFTTCTCTTTSLMIGAKLEYVSTGTKWLVTEGSVGPTYTLS